MAMTAAKSFQNYIGGEWVDAASGETFETKSPATGETLGVFPRSSAEDVDKAIAAFDRHGRSVVLFGRLVPAIRTLISVPAGLACMSLGQFLFFSTIGSLAWTGVLTALIAYAIKFTIGWRVSQDEEIEGIDFSEHGESAYDLDGRPGGILSGSSSGSVLTSTSAPEGANA